MAATEGERLFREYLDNHGYQYERPDEDDRNHRAADFRIFRNGQPLAIAEVKQWDRFASPYPSAGSVGMVDPDKLYLPIRRSVGSAAPQLKAHLQEGLPLVVVLTNPKGFPVPLSEEDVRSALHGNPTATFTVDLSTGAAVSDVALVYGHGSRVRPSGDADAGRHPYISAVSVLHERSYEADWHENRRMIGFGEPPRSIAEAAERSIPFMKNLKRERTSADIPPGTYLGLDVYETFSVTTGDAVALGAHVFDGPGDRRFCFTADRESRLHRGRNVGKLFARAREAPDATDDRRPFAKIS